MAGDPCQLPPVVAAPAAVTPRPAAMGPAFAALGAASTAVGHASSAVGPASAAGGPASAAARPAATAVGCASGADAASTLQQPLQESSAGGNAAGGKSPAAGAGLQGLARPLLVRLIQMGHKAHLLRTQYRQSIIDPSLVKASSAEIRCQLYL